MDFIHKQKAYITDHWNFMLDENKKVRKTKDLYEWAAWMEQAAKKGSKSNRIVKQTHLKNGLFVSTVFLGVDYNFTGQGDPVLFETMVFDSTKKRNTGIVLSTGKTERFIDNLGEDLYQTRYCTYEEALKGHKETIKKFKTYDRTKQKPYST